MNILAIETSCDETAVAILECEGDVISPSFRILGNTLLSQAEIHAPFGGVYPNLAKREHSRNLVPLLKHTMEQAFGSQKSKVKSQNDISKFKNKLEQILEREPELLTQFIEFIPTIEKPDLDYIAVTAGPGLEPALWVGINFAKALSLVWNVPIIPINHMEGHIISALLEKKRKNELSISRFQFPLLALLISGGHTELILMRHWFGYELLGETLDDAVGEAFDKVARMLALPYPGGPEISRLAKEARDIKRERSITLPRPMIKSDSCDFSFSGLKTAFLYSLKNVTNVTNEVKQEFAKEFEDAVVEILTTKTRKALKTHHAKTLILGGGVSANDSIRDAFRTLIQKEFSPVRLNIPSAEFTTDNAIMIGAAAYLRAIIGKQSTTDTGEMRARGNLKLVP